MTALEDFWDKYGTAIGAVIWAVLIAGVIWLSVNSSDDSSTDTSTPTTQEYTQPAVSQPAASDDSQVSQSYWYCWDTGNPSPHHLGYRVSGDHYCTNGELRAAGKL